MNKISVIIPLYNSASTLSRCLNSLIEQKYKNIEVIIIDDGSTDNSIKLIEEKYSSYPFRVFSQANSGAAAARNFGLSVATGDYIKFLDSDDELTNDSLLTQISLAEKLTQSQILYGDSMLRSGSFSHYNKVMLPIRDQHRALVNKNIQTGLALYPRLALKEVGGFDPSLMFRQEFSLNLKLSLAGYTFKRSPFLVYIQHIDDRPFRISSRHLCAMTEKENLQKIFLSCHCKDTKYIEAWSFKFWNIGRQFLKQKRYRDASIFFKAGKSLTINYKRSWPLPYRLIVSLLGAEKAELFINQVSQLRRRT